MALRSLSSCYTVPVERLASIDFDESARLRREFMQRYDVRAMMPEHNRELSARLYGDGPSSSDC